MRQKEARERASSSVNSVSLNPIKKDESEIVGEETRDIQVAGHGLIGEIEPQRGPVTRTGEEEVDPIGGEQVRRIVAYQPGAAIGNDGVRARGGNQQDPPGHDAALPTNSMPSPTDR